MTPPLPGLPVVEAGLLRRMLCWVHLALFTAVSFVAPGMMPAFQADGRTIVICTGNGLIELALDRDGNPVEKEQPQCAWSLHTGAVDVAHLPPDVTGVEFHSAPIAFPRLVAAIDRHSSDHHRPRAPPHLL